MPAVLLDTHAWVWTLYLPERLSSTAREAIEGAEAVYVSPVTFFEIGQKVRIGKWPQMAPFVDELPGLLERQGGLSAPLDASICLRAGTLEWGPSGPVRPVARVNQHPDRHRARVRRRGVRRADDDVAAGAADLVAVRRSSGTSRRSIDGSSWRRAVEHVR